MKRCEQKIRYRAAAGAKWALWRIWIIATVEGGGTAANGVRTPVPFARGGTSRRSPSGGVERSAQALGVDGDGCAARLRVSFAGTLTGTAVSQRRDQENGKPIS